MRDEWSPMLHKNGPGDNVAGPLHERLWIGQFGILHLPTCLSWSFSTMVATVLSR